MRTDEETQGLAQNLKKELSSIFPKCKFTLESRGLHHNDAVIIRWWQPKHFSKNKILEQILEVTNREDVVISMDTKKFVNTKTIFFQYRLDLRRRN